MSKPIVVNISHELGRQAAKQRMQEGFGRIREQLGGKSLVFEERWDGDRLHFNAGALGQKVSGTVDVQDSKVRIEVDLPWMLAMLADKVTGQVQHQAQLLLGP